MIFQVDGQGMWPCYCEYQVGKKNLGIGTPLNVQISDHLPLALSEDYNPCSVAREPSVQRSDKV